MKLICKKHKDQIVEVFKVMFKRLPDGKEVSDVKCPICGEYMVYLPDPSKKLDLKSINFGMFSAMSSDMKKDHLKRRSREDNYKKSAVDKRKDIDFQKRQKIINR